MRDRNDLPSLPLFAWTPPTATVIPFPCRARVGKVRRTAEMINGTTPRGAEAYWQRTMSDLNRQMARAGVPEALIEAELTDFRLTVQAEIARRGRGFKGGSTGGDAA